MVVGEPEHGAGWCACGAEESSAGVAMVDIPDHLGGGGESRPSKLFKKVAWTEREKREINRIEGREREGLAERDATEESRSETEIS